LYFSALFGKILEAGSESEKQEEPEKDDVI